MAKNKQINIIIEAKDNASKQLKEVDKGLQNITESTTNTSKGFESLKGMAVGLGGAFAAMQLLRTTAELQQMGLEADRTLNTYAALSGGVLEAADSLELMRQATYDSVDDMTLMQQGSNLLRMGLADTGEEVARLIEMATALKKPTDTAADAIENFAMMLANQSIPRLDSFGMSSGKVRKELNALIETGMGREDAFMTAVLNQGTVAMDRLGESIQQNVSHVEQLSTRFQNLKASVAMGVSSVVEGAAQAVVSVINALEREEINLTAHLAIDIEESGASGSGGSSSGAPVIGSMEYYLSPETSQIMADVISMFDAGQVDNILSTAQDIWDTQVRANQVDPAMSIMDYPILIDDLTSALFGEYYDASDMQHSATLDLITATEEHTEELQGAYEQSERYNKNLETINDRAAVSGSFMSAGGAGYSRPTATGLPGGGDFMSLVSSVTDSFNDMSWMMGEVMQAGQRNQAVDRAMNTTYSSVTQGFGQQGMSGFVGQVGQAVMAAMSEQGSSAADVEDAGLAFSGVNVAAMDDFQEETIPGLAAAIRDGSISELQAQQIASEAETVRALIAEGVIPEEDFNQALIGAVEQHGITMALDGSELPTYATREVETGYTVGQTGYLEGLGEQGVEDAGGVDAALALYTDPEFHAILQAVRDGIPGFDPSNPDHVTVTENMARAQIAGQSAGATESEVYRAGSNFVTSFASGEGAAPMTDAQRQEYYKGAYGVDISDLGSNPDNPMWVKLADEASDLDKTTGKSAGGLRLSTDQKLYANNILEQYGMSPDEYSAMVDSIRNPQPESGGMGGPIDYNTARGIVGGVGGGLNPMQGGAMGMIGVPGLGGDLETSARAAEDINTAFTMMPTFVGSVGETLVGWNDQITIFNDEIETAQLALDDIADSVFVTTIKLKLDDTEVYAWLRVMMTELVAANNGKVPGSDSRGTVEREAMAG